MTESLNANNWVRSCSVWDERKIKSGNYTFAVSRKGRSLIIDNLIDDCRYPAIIKAPTETRLVHAILSPTGPMPPPQFCLSRHVGNGELNAVCKQGDFSLREYTPVDMMVVMELFKQGMLDGINREERPALYQEVEFFVNSAIPDFDDVPAMVNYDNGGRLFVAKNEKSEILGTIGIIVNDEDLEKKRGQLVRLSVSNKSRGLGIGRFLLQFLVDYARDELKLSVIHLGTLSIFTAACALYAKFGFKETSRIPHVPEYNTFIILMELTLD